MSESVAADIQQREHERLKMLLKVAGSISSEMQLDKLLRLIMDEIKQVLQCDRCTVFVLDREHNELWSRVAHGESEIRFPAHLGIAGAVATTGKVINIPDAYSDSRFNPNIDRQTGYHTRNILAAPMRNKPGEIIGVFQTLNKFDGPFTVEDEEILNAISVLSATQIENVQLYEEQVKTFNSLIETLASTIDARDPLTSGHSKRIALYADEMARVLNLSAQEREVLRISALLHDYGKIAVRESVLNKDDRLTDEEYRHIRNHAAYTRSILEKIHFSRELRLVPLIAASHHERLDGTGYPAGLQGDQIPLLSKILAVADVFDALTSKRQYRTRMPFREVIELLHAGIGTQFDPLPVEAFRSIRLDRLLRILESGHQEALAPDDLEFLAGYNVVDYIAAAAASGPPAGSLSTAAPAELVRIFQHYYQHHYLESGEAAVAAEKG